MSLWRLISDSWRTYGARWTAFLVIGFVYIVLIWLLGLAVKPLFGMLDPQVDRAQFVSMAIGVSIIRWTILLFTTFAIVRFADRGSGVESIGLGKSHDLPLSWRLLWRFLATAILYFLIVSGGAILLVIPGLIWGTTYVLAPYVALTENVSPKEALKRSAATVTGQRISIFTYELTTAALFLMFIAGTVVVLLVAISLGHGQPFPSHFSVGPLTMNFGTPTSQDTVWGEIIQRFGTITWHTMLIIFNLVLFKTLRMNREGR